MSTETAELEPYRKAWEIYRADPLPWVILYGAVFGISVVTLGLGMVLLPNALRATRDALEKGAAPDLSRLWVFDRLTEDAIVVAALVAGMVMISTFLGPLAPVIGFLLAFALPIVADGRYAGLDALRLSVALVSDKPKESLIHAGLTSVILTPAALCCFLPTPLLLPLVGLSTWLAYVEQRPAVARLAQEQGAKPGA